MRALFWFAGVVCLTMLAPSTEGATRTVAVTDNGGGAFVDPVSGNSTTNISADDTITWSWGSGTILGHTTTSGTCCTENGIWDSGNLLQTTGTFPVPVGTFSTPGPYPYFCSVHLSLMTGVVNVTAGALHHFEVIASVTSVTAGNSFNVTVRAKDQFNNTITNYAGTVHLDSNDPNDTMPANNTLPGGVRTFTGVVLRTSGSRTITVNDTVQTTKTGTDTVTVNPAAASQLVLTAPANASSGVNFLTTVTARDQFNNTATSYGGTVHFTSSDGDAILPADNTLLSGSRSFNVRLATPGSQTLTVTDTANGALTDTANINVNQACSMTFSNASAITIPSSGAGSPYPSTITVAGLKQTISGMSVTLNGITHGVLRDVDVLLVGPGGQKFIIMSDAGGDASNVTLSLTDSASQTLPSADALTSGSFRPTNFSVGDTFTAPAPLGPYSGPAPAESATFASVFNGANPNGVWSLFVVDDLGGFAGSIAGGWSLTFAPPANTFCNQSSISLPDAARAVPYPSTINVSGLDGTITNVAVRFDRLTEVINAVTDLDMLLVSPGGQKMIIMSDAGGTVASNVVMTLDDSGAAMPAPLVSGVFRATNIGTGDTFLSPAPAGPYSDPAAGANFSVFDGTAPNGNWQLYILDDFDDFLFNSSGNIAGGWALTFDVVFNTTTALTSSGNPGAVGTIVTLTAEVTSSGGTPTGSVTFRLAGVNIGTVNLVNGEASLAVELAAGTHNLTATYNGSANFHPSTSTTLAQVMNPGPTTTTVESSLNPSTFGQSVTFTATVRDTSFLIPLGTVTFMDGAATLGTGTVDVNGVATFTTSLLAGGSRSITAAYGGSSNFLGSSSSILTQTVNKANTTSAVVTSVSPSTFGTSITFTATVSESTPGTATGTVTFRDGTTTLGTGTLNGSGVATFSTSALTAGSHSINVVYGGDGNFNGSTSLSITQTVNKRTPTASVISFLNPSNFTEEVIFRADVAATVTPPAAAPTGTVTFRDAAATLGTIALSAGTAQFSTSALAGGNHNITAVYNGDSNYNTQTSAILVQEVSAAETSTALGSSLNPSTFGQPVTFTATVTSGVGTPSGTVTFMDGLTPLGAPAALNGLGLATLTTPSLSAGTHSITAIYNSNGSFAPSTSAAVIQEIEQSAITVLLTAPKETSVFREAITFTVTVDSTTSGTPTGTVTFFDGSAELGSASLNGVGEGSLTIIGLPVGKHEITVQYAGDSNFPANTSPPLLHYRSPRPR